MVRSPKFWCRRGYTILDEGKFPILYPEYLVRSQIAIAERLEAILDSLEVQRLGNLPTSLGKASESNRRALRKKAC